MLYFEDELKKQSYKQKIFKRNYRYYNKVSICEELSAQDWSNIENGTNVNDAYDTFFYKLLEPFVISMLQF